MALLQPDETFLCYRDLTAELLQAKGISVLLLDIDNTLAPYEQSEPDGRIVAWLASLESAGIRVAFLSNNHEERVTLFNRSLGLPLRFDAHKPLPRTARRLARELGGEKRTTALMGDQIFTDVLCARWCGFRAFLVPPIKDRTDAGTRLKRYLERGILRRYYRRHPEAPDIRRGSPLTAEALRSIENQKR